MRWKWFVTLCMAAALLTQGCSAVRVSQDYDVNEPFPRHGTWTWRDQAQPGTGDIRVDSPLLDRRIRKAVTAGLEARRFHQQDASPAFRVAYHLVIEPRIEADTYYSGMGFRRYHPAWFGGMGREVRITHYNEGRLTLDILFAGTNALLWRGTGVYRFNTDQKTPTEIDAEIQNIVDRMLSQFPPGN